MTGFAARTGPATGTSDPIMARAVLLDDGESKLAIVACDLLGFAPEAVADMRRRIAEKCGIPAQSVFICCTHTHSGPASMPMRGMGTVDEKWLASAQSRIVDLVAGLPTGLKLARIRHGSATVSGIDHNRQDESRPTDEELIAVAVDSADGHAIATLLNYATHAVVLGPSNMEFSADFPGEATRQVERLRGGVGLYLQGACGDVDPVVYRDRGWGSGTFDDTAAMGKRLADEAARILAEAAATEDVTIRVSNKVVDLPLDPPPSADDLGKLIAGYEEQRRTTDNAVQRQVAEGMLQWANELKAAMETNTVPKTVPVEVFAGGINDLRLVGLPFETYTDIGLGIKNALKPLKALYVGYANGLYGYLATRWAKDQGGYGPAESCRWFGGLLTAPGYGADEMLIGEGVAVGKSL